MARISVSNEWSRLGETVLGIAPTLYFPGIHPIEREPAAFMWRKILSGVLYPLADGRRVPGWISRKYVAELDRLHEVLIGHGVTVHRPAAVTPLPGEPLGLGQMFARDPVFAVGDILVDGKLKMDMRHKERRGLVPLLSAFARSGAHVVSVPSGDVFLEGGDVIVDLPYVYVGIGKYASNMDGVRWLQAQLGPQVNVVPVPLAVPGILHLDCCMTLIGEGLGIIHRDSLAHPLPHPLDTYKFIEIAGPARQQLGTNVLVLDPATIVVQQRHVQLQQQLRKKGFHVIPIEFNWHALLGGAFRCATAPLFRG